MYKKLYKEVELLLKKGGVVFFLRMISMVLSFFTTWFITNRYGESTFGRFSLSLTVLQIIFLFSALGLPNVFLAYTGGFDNDYLKKGFLVKTSKMVLIFSTIPISLLYFGSDFIATVIFEKEALNLYFTAIAFAIPFMVLHEIICYYFISVNKYLIYGLLLFIIPNVLFISFLYLSHQFQLPEYFTFFDYILAIFITVVIGYFVAFFKCRNFKIPEISTKQILVKSTPMMLSSMFLLLLNWTDILMLGKMETEENIGIYNAAFKVGYLTLFFGATMNVIIMPKVSKLFHAKDLIGMKKVVNKATQIVILLTLPLTLVLIFFSEEILSLFGSGFSAGATCLVLISIGGLFNAMTGNVDQILNMTDNQKIVRNIFVFGFLFNAISNYFLINDYGIEGAAFASLITNIMVNFIFVLIIKRKLGFYTFM